MDNDRKTLINFIRSTFPISEFASKTTAENFQQIRYRKNDFVLNEGQICSDYLFLEQGFMRAFVYDTTGDDVTTGFFSTNEMVFEVSSYFQRTPSKENIQALTDCLGWVGNYRQLQPLFHSLPEYREFGRAILVKGVIALKERTLSMITQKAEERYETLLKSNPAIFQNAPLKYIASYLGITDTSLSRIRKEFAHK